MRVLLQWYRNAVVELYARLAKPLAVSAAGEVESFVSAAIDKDLDAVDIQPIWTLDANLKINRATGGDQVLPGPTRLSPEVAVTSINGPLVITTWPPSSAWQVSMRSAFAGSSVDERTKLRSPPLP